MLGLIIKMKKKNNLYYSICNLNNIRYIYDNKVKKNTKNKKKVLSFDNYYMENIFLIREHLKKELYEPGTYNIFFVKEPKIRVVMSQNMYDKVINHLVSYYILRPAILPCLIEQNVATREGKGTDYGIKLMKRYLNKIKFQSNQFYVLKFDISKYFYNINHDVLKCLLYKKIKDKKALNIIFKIIDSTNESYINEEINKLINYYRKNITNDKIMDELEKIPFYKEGKGLPIGNMTSQILAIFYLNDLDHFIKERLRIKYYIRYMDDGVLIHRDKNYLKYCLKEIKFKIEKEYKLTLNKKTKIYSSNEKIEFLGFIYYLKNQKLIVKVKTQTKRKFKRKIKSLRSVDNEKYEHVLASYQGHLKYANSKNLIYETVFQNKY